jgi:hypothetical protein
MRRLGQRRALTTQPVPPGRASYPVRHGAAHSWRTRSLRLGGFFWLWLLLVPYAQAGPCGLGPATDCGCQAWFSPARDSLTVVFAFRDSDEWARPLDYTPGGFWAIPWFGIWRSAKDRGDLYPKPTPDVYVYRHYQTNPVWWVRVDGHGSEMGPRQWPYPIAWGTVRRDERRVYATVPLAGFGVLPDTLFIANYTHHLQDNRWLYLSVCDCEITRP